MAKLSRHLPADRVGVVDTAVARVLGRESGGRVLDLAEGAILKADPALHDQRVEAERRRRYVGLSRTDEFGLRTVIARVEAGDAVWIDATVARVSEILAPRHPESSADEIRAVAFGWLARPAELLQLLLEHTDDVEEPAVEGGDATLVESEPEPEPGPARATAFPADLLDALRDVDLTPLAPKVTLYVHLHQAAIDGAGGIARVEGLGPMTMTQLQGLLAHARLVVKPVLDLSRRVRTTAYEHPDSLKEQIHLTTGGDYWPYAASTSRSVDHDHPTAYDDTGPPAAPPQTGSHNSGPLGRRHHRWKTHAGYRSRQSGEGRYVWITPHGLSFLVDHRGTRAIARDRAQMIHDAPAGVDIYPTWATARR